MKPYLALAVALLAACGGGGSSPSGGEPADAAPADSAPSGFAYQVTIRVDTGDAPQVASFTVDGTTYAPGDTATYTHTFSTFAASQAGGIAVTATSLNGDTYTFTVMATTCGGDDCAEPTGETCANLSAESERWILHSASAGSSGADVILDADSGTCDYVDGRQVGWSS